MTLKKLAGAVMMATFCSSNYAEVAGRPNILLIIADDLGFSDLGCYGGEAATPNLDRLAERGVRFSQFYNCGKCEPTRAALMTGHRNTPQIGFRAERAKTYMADVLRADGYRTLMAGKWHVNKNPLDHGFDRFYGIEEGACNYCTGSGHIRLGRDIVPVPENFYTTDVFTDYALRFLDESKRTDDELPFFLYLAYNAPHDPLQVPPEEIDKYRGTYLKGWHEVKHQRLKKLREIGLVPKSIRRTDWPENLPRWDTLSEAQQKTEDLRMAVFAAMIDRMDRNIGRIFQWLEENNELENTLILFVSDNGANPFDRGSQEMVKEDIPPGGPNSHWSLGTAWAHVCNTPFRMYKRNQHEGGICAPMIAAGPGLAYAAGSISTLPVHVLDFLPTFHTLAGGTSRPEDIEGTDLSNLWKNGDQNREFDMAGYMADHRYIRHNEWKLVSVDCQPWELFNLNDDRSETQNLIAEFPEKARQLETAWDRWYSEVAGGEPFLDPNETTQKTRRRESAHMGDKGSGIHYVPVALP